MEKYKEALSKEKRKFINQTVSLMSTLKISDDKIELTEHIIEAAFERAYEVIIKETANISVDEDLPPGLEEETPIQTGDARNIPKRPFIKPAKLGHTHGEKKSNLNLRVLLNDIFKYNLPQSEVRVFFEKEIIEKNNTNQTSIDANIARLEQLGFGESISYIDNGFVDGEYVSNKWDFLAGD